jgi:hypothetical protein
MCIRKIRYYFKGFVEIGDRFIQLPRMIKGIGKIGVKLRAVWLEFQGRAMMFYGFAGFACANEKNAEVGMGICKIRFYTDRVS